MSVYIYTNTYYIIIAIYLDIIFLFHLLPKETKHWGIFYVSESLQD